MRRTGHAGLPAWSLLGLAGLFTPVVVLHEAVFAGGVGAWAAGGGVAVGLLIAWASTRWSWDLVSTGVVGLTAYLGLGGWFALKSTVMWGVVPTWATVQMLVWGAVHGWRDLLTLSPPVGIYAGVAVVPWLVGLVCGGVAGLLTMRRGRFVVGTVPVVVMAVIGVAWGWSGLEPPAWPVVLWMAGLLGWWAWWRQWVQMRAGHEVVAGQGASGRVEETTAVSGGTSGQGMSAVMRGQRLLVGGLTLALAGALAIVVVPYWPGLEDRTVLRDLVEPPVDARDYASPLSSFRHYTTDLADTPLVTASALPVGTRIRLATMDSYDGITMGMADPATAGDDRYVRAGTRLPADEHAGGRIRLDVRTGPLSGPWLPSVQTPARVVLPDTAARDALHVNNAAATLMLASGSAADVSYTLEAVGAPEPSDGALEGLSVAAPSGGSDTGVPESVTELAFEVTAAEQSALGRARAIERYLSGTGRFSNHVTEVSRPGHRADRLTRMLQREQLVGDDEQYAVLMQLMLHQLGLDARVVMGLYPENWPAEGEPVTLTGGEVHAWVEVPFAGVGWVTFDPTPPRDQVPQTDVPQPRSVPRPQVLQPPDPPKPPVELPPNVSDRPVLDRPEPTVEIPWPWVAGGGGALFVLVGPLLAIVGWKARRRAVRRRQADPREAVTGAWDEARDRAVDAGIQITPVMTRQEVAGLLLPADTVTDPWAGTDADVAEPLALARRADAANYGLEVPDTVAVAAAWQSTAAVQALLADGVGWWGRVRQRLSVRSLRPGRQKRSRR
ncbi:MAG: transglutaminase-like domain-containing protein [Propioniciclava sp.]